jgi:hypothetical protein
MQCGLRKKWEAKSERKIMIPSLPPIHGAQDPRVFKICIANVCHWELKGVFFLAGGVFLCHADPEDSNTGLQVSHASLLRHAHNIFALSSMRCAPSHTGGDVFEDKDTYRRNPHGRHALQAWEAICFLAMIDARTSIRLSAHIDLVELDFSVLNYTNRPFARMSRK